MLWRTFRERKISVSFISYEKFFATFFIRGMKPLRLWSSSVADINNRRIPNVCGITMCILLSPIIPSVYLSLFRYIFFKFSPVNSYHASNNFRNTQVLCTRSLISSDTFAERGKFLLEWKLSTSIWIFDEVILADARDTLGFDTVTRDKLTPWSIGRNENIYHPRERSAGERSYVLAFRKQKEMLRKEYRGWLVATSFVRSGIDERKFFSSQIYRSKQRNTSGRVFNLSGLIDSKPIARPTG